MKHASSEFISQQKMFTGDVARLSGGLTSRFSRAKKYRANLLFCFLLFTFFAGNSYSQNGKDCSSAILLDDSVHALPARDSHTVTWYKFHATSDNMEIKLNANYILFESGPRLFCSKWEAGKIRPYRKYIHPDEKEFGKAYSITEEELSGKCCCYNCLKESGKLNLKEDQLYYLMVKGNPDTLRLVNNHTPKIPEDPMEEEPELEVKTAPEMPKKLENLTSDDLKEGNKIELEEIYFRGGSVQLLPKSFETLEKLHVFLTQNNTLKVEIQGHVHAPDIPNNEYNQKLSEGRAKNVMDYLIKKGIHKNRLDYKGFGNTEMKYPQAVDSEEARKNRRVEVMVVSK